MLREIKYVVLRKKVNLFTGHLQLSQKTNFSSCFGASKGNKNGDDAGMSATHWYKISKWSIEEDGVEITGKRKLTLDQILKKGTTRKTLMKISMHSPFCWEHFMPCPFDKQIFKVYKTIEARSGQIMRLTRHCACRLFCCCHPSL